MTKTIDVEIYGQRYSITRRGGRILRQELAELVDKHMKQVAAGMRSATPGEVGSPRSIQYRP